MPETIRGFKALRARHEILAVRQEHHRLLRERDRTGCFTPEGKELTRRIRTNIARLDEIEARYFGAKPKAKEPELE